MVVRGAAFARNAGSASLYGVSLATGRITPHSLQSRDASGTNHTLGTRFGRWLVTLSRSLVLPYGFGRCSAIGRLLGDGVQRPQSTALWASFDDTEGRWGSRERHIEGRYRLGETYQCQAAEVFECGYFLYG